MKGGASPQTLLFITAKEAKSTAKQEEENKYKEEDF